ncbi:uncharacterized protein VP01_12136g1, partial [Puccinia sorghi]
PQNYQELYNLRHLSAQDVIKRIFGVVKRRFKVFATGCHYNIEIQVKVIILMTFLHNFMQVNNPNDELTCINIGYLPTSDRGSARDSSKRENITKKMWDDYQHHLQYRQWCEKKNRLRR